MEESFCDKYLPSWVCHSLKERAACFSVSVHLFWDRVLEHFVLELTIELSMTLNFRSSCSPSVQITSFHRQLLPCYVLGFNIVTWGNTNIQTMECFCLCYELPQSPFLHSWELEEWVELGSCDRISKEVEVGSNELIPGNSKYNRKKMYYE